MDLACIAQKLSGVFFRESHRAPGCPKPSRHRDRSAPPSRKQNVIGDSSQSRAHQSPPEVSAQCQWSHHAQGPWTQPPSFRRGPSTRGTGGAVAAKVPQGLRAAAQKELGDLLSSGGSGAVLPGDPGVHRTCRGQRGLSGT